MTSTKCNAKDPAACRYHGARAGSLVTVLKSQMIVAHSVYKAAETLSEQFDAYTKVREAEISYYATDTGASELEKKITTTPTGEYRDLLLDIQKRASELRNDHEEMDSVMSSWGPTALIRTVEPTVRTLEDGSSVHVLSSLKKFSGDTAVYEWNETTGSLTYSEHSDTDAAAPHLRKWLGKHLDLESANKAIKNPS